MCQRYDYQVIFLQATVSNVHMVTKGRSFGDAPSFPALNFPRLSITELYPQTILPRGFFPFSSRSCQLLLSRHSFISHQRIITSCFFIVHSTSYQQVPPPSSTRVAITQRMADFKCDSCPRWFLDWNAASQHMDALDHWIWPYECDTCTARFDTERGVDAHMRAKGHFSYDYECETCDLSFRTEKDCKDHQEAEGHYEDVWCDDCDRYIHHPEDLAQHRNSSVHKGQQLCCPFCHEAFTAISAITQHVESSSCPNAIRMNRSSVHQWARQGDPNGFVTENLLEGADPPLNVTRNPNSAWNGYYYECYICNAEFDTPNALNQHVTSPAHQSRLYHCPNRIECGARHFPSLGFLISHLESRVCGFVTFAAAAAAAVIHVAVPTINGGQKVIEGRQVLVHQAEMPIERGPAVIKVEDGVTIKDEDRFEEL